MDDAVMDALARAVLDRVGRIDLRNHRKAWVGTGFLVAERVVATAGCVAHEFLERGASGLSWAETPEGVPVEAYWVASERRLIDGAVALEPRTAGRHDLALLRLGHPVGPEPPPVELMSDEEYASVGTGREVVVAGFFGLEVADRHEVAAHEIATGGRVTAAGRVASVDGGRLWIEGGLEGGCAGAVVLDRETHKALGVASVRDLATGSVVVTGAPAIRALLESVTSPKGPEATPIASVEARGRLQSLNDPGAGMRASGMREAALRNGRVRTARIEIEGNAVATGFLVGPRWLLTAGHVFAEELGDGTELSGVVVRFDFVPSGLDTPSEAETGVSVTATRLVAVSPPTRRERRGDLDFTADSRHLDYALVELDRDVALSDGDEPARGFFELHDRRYAFSSSLTYDLFAHPIGMAQQQADVRASRVNASGTRVAYTTNTEEGSSGAPIIDREGRAVALHTFGSMPDNVGVPISVIAADLQSRGLLLPRAKPARAIPRRSGFVARYVPVGTLVIATSGTLAASAINLLWRGSPWWLGWLALLAPCLAWRWRALSAGRKWTGRLQRASTSVSWLALSVYLAVPIGLQLAGHFFRGSGVPTWAFRTVGATVPAAAVLLRKNAEQLAASGDLAMVLPEPCEAPHQLRDAKIYVLGESSQEDEIIRASMGVGDEYSVVRRQECDVDTPDQLAIAIHNAADDYTFTCEVPQVVSIAPDQWAIDEVECNPE